MARQLKAAILCTVVAALFVALQLVFRIQTGLAGLFIMGMAGGLLIGNQITKVAPPRVAA